MVTPLRAPLRREIRVLGRPWVVTISDDGLKLAEKGRRKGFELRWEGLLSGDAALAAALNAGMRGAPAPRAGQDGPAARERRAPRRSTAR